MKLSAKKAAVIAALFLTIFIIFFYAWSKNQMANQQNLPVNNLSLQVGTKVLYKTISIGEYDVFYRESGNTDKPTILLLHGFPSSSRMWQPLLEGLSNDYHLIAPDYIGFGHSSQPDNDSFDYTFDNLATYINQFIDKLSLKKFILVQQDYGGPIGMRIAEKNPDKVQAIII
ncbi:MAG: alpha/beta fold hydrolase, partial [Planctomycetaceae bacterium]|nr:alpha/beta fold hydrolase [Planctomycetaceae bacterium]